MNEKPRAFGNTDEIEPELDEEGGELATEEEQQDYDMLVIRSGKMMLGEGRDNILDMLGSSETPAKGLGKVAAMLIKSLVDSAKQGGREISPDAAMAAGAEVIEELSDLAKKNGIFQYDSEEEETSQLSDAMMWGVKFYGDGMVQAGEITPEIQSAAKQQVDEGLASEGQQTDQVGQAVNEAMAPKQPMAGPGRGGMVNNAIQQGTQPGAV